MFHSSSASLCPTLTSQNFTIICLTVLLGMKKKTPHQYGTILEVLSEEEHTKLAEFIMDQHQVLFFIKDCHGVKHLHAASGRVLEIVLLISLRKICKGLVGARFDNWENPAVALKTMPGFVGGYFSLLDYSSSPGFSRLTFTLHQNRGEYPVIWRSDDSGYRSSLLSEDVAKKVRNSLNYPSCDFTTLVDLTVKVFDMFKTDEHNRGEEFQTFLVFGRSTERIMAKPSLNYDGTMKKPREFSLTRKDFANLRVLIDRDVQAVQAEEPRVPAITDQADLLLQTADRVDLQTFQNITS